MEQTNIIGSEVNTSHVISLEDVGEEYIKYNQVGARIGVSIGYWKSSDDRYRVIEVGSGLGLGRHY